MRLFVVILIILFTGIIYYTFFSKLRVSAFDAKNIINKYNAKVIDVRTVFEWNYGHYKNAINMTEKDINLENLAKNNISKNDFIIVYCNTGQRARSAAEKIYNLGFKNVKYIVEPYTFLN